MRVFDRQCSVPAPAEALSAWHAQPGAFERLLPPWQKVRIVDMSGAMADRRVVLAISRGPFTLHWRAEHRDDVPGREFTDVQTSGPMPHWVHTHRFLPDGADRSILSDRVEYRPPAWPLSIGLERDLERMFRFRHERTIGDLRRHRAAEPHRPMRIVMSGASGLIGRNLRAFLSSGGHRVDALVRRAPRAGSGDIQWEPATGRVELSRLESSDAVIHLAGENIAAGRWTEARKAAIRDSRVVATRRLCESLAALRRKPRVLLCASAIGYYGDRGDEVLTEQSPPGDTFLAEVGRAWEAATAPASAAGIAVTHLRIGIVISAQDGVLGRLRLPFSLGLGGRVGSGRQYMSWISLDDTIGAIHAALLNDRLRGPLNLVAPQPVTNAEFARTLGRVLRRPTPFPVPAWLVRTAFGQMGRELLLCGARVVPEKLTTAGFAFYHPTLESALRFEMGR